MQSTIEDRLVIIDLMNGWIYRDKADWEKLEQLFHKDGSIEVTWFDGPFIEFIAASRRMGASDLRTKHFVSNPIIEFCGDKAISETNAIILCDNAKTGLGCNAHARLYDQLERRDGVWRILKRRCFYDMGNLTSTPDAHPIDGEMFARFPREYAALAYVLETSGFPVNRILPTRNSKLESDIKANAEHWLGIH